MATVVEEKSCVVDSTKLRSRLELDKIQVELSGALRKLAEGLPHICFETVVESVVRPFIITDDDFKKFMDAAMASFERGLGKETHEKSVVKMYPTYVRSVPDGTERGNFLALDVGGTNFRVLLINLAKEEIKMESKIYVIPQKLMVGHGSELFDFIAESIYKFLRDKNLLGIKLPLGFTFSFCCKQVGLDKAILTQWAKGFKCDGVEGHDIVELLHDAIKRRGDINDVECIAVTNDTVGTLISCAHSEKACGIGCILGTGTNACYFEKLENVETWDGDNNDPKEVIINTEWGAIGDDGVIDCLMTEFDKNIDRHSIDPGVHRFEKMISGMYLGEVARLVIEKLRKHNLLFGGKGSPELNTRGRFYTKYLSEIETNVQHSICHTREVLKEMGIDAPTDQDCQIVYHVCSLVSSRAAQLAAAGVACLLNKMNRPYVVVGMDGSLYRLHPHFHDIMEETIRKLVKPGIDFKLIISNDGSGKGAALVAAVAHRLKYGQS